jgi:hypothetical protein
MATESENNLRLEIGHVLFIDLVGYSKLLIEDQKARLSKLTEIVLAATQVAEANDEQLVRLPTGDGMALVFRDSAEEPAQCALETAYANRDGALPRLFIIPFLMDYRDDPRFAAFCRKLGIENLPPKP